MRPRLITAENEIVRFREVAEDPGFNEAAAHHRGEPEVCMYSFITRLPLQ